VVNARFLQESSVFYPDVPSVPNSHAIIVP
jgi:hypothetical protein